MNGMKLRDSGMPDEAYWETLFDVRLVLERLGIDDSLGDVVELGCGYGTFSIPVARVIRGTLRTFDIDPAMVARTDERAAAELPSGKLVCSLRDVATNGFGVGGVDAALVFNLLHCDEPVALLNRAADAVRPGGLVLAIHWRYAETPRGPNLDIRPRPEQIATWAQQTGRLVREGNLIDLPPWHYGWRFRVTSTHLRTTRHHQPAARKLNPAASTSRCGTREPSSRTPAPSGWEFSSWRSR